MHGSSTGVVATDPRGPDYLESCLRDAHEALRVFNAAAKAACDIGEHKLQREAEDAAGRLVAVIEALKQEARATRKRLAGGAPLHGEDQEAAEVAE